MIPDPEAFPVLELSPAELVAEHGIDTRTITALERFATKYAILPDGCWQWTAGLDTWGYAHFWYDGGDIGGHRFAWLQTVGEVPAGMQLDHLCRNRACVNPDHLELVTIGENVLRGDGITAENARKTHCKHGHPFDEANTHTYLRAGLPARKCRACARAAWHQAKARRETQRIEGQWVSLSRARLGPEEEA